MFKRLRWFVMGTGAGVGGSVWAQRQLREQREKLTPEAVAKAAARKAKDQAAQAPQRMKRSIAAGRDAYRNPDVDVIEVAETAAGHQTSVSEERDARGPVRPDRNRVSRRLGHELRRRTNR